MRVTDDHLRSLLTVRAASRGACPSAETLAAAAAGQLPDPERGSVIEHLGRCRDCAEEVKLLGPLEAWAQEVAARVESPRPRPAAARSAWTRWPLWAAAAVMVLGLPVLMWAPGNRGPEPLRAPPGPAILSLLPDATPVPRSRCLLRWSDVGGGARYSVSVLSKDLRPLASAERLERPEHLVSPDALKAVPPGGEIVWSVEARWPDGRRLGSRAFVNRLD